MDLPEILAEQREFLESTLRPSVEISFELRSTKPWESPPAKTAPRRPG